jgi:hypothetical protein
MLAWQRCRGDAANGGCRASNLSRRMADMGPSRAMEQGQARRAEDALPAQGNLGYPSPFAASRPGPRPRAFQPWHRQQAQSLRLGESPCPRRFNRRARGDPRQGAAEDRTAGSARDNRPNAPGRRARIARAQLKPGDYLFPSRIHESPHIGTRQYARIVDGWVEEIDLDSATCGIHSVRRTKDSLIYRRTKNLAPSNFCSAAASSTISRSGLCPAAHATASGQPRTSRNIGGCATSP